jgi:hypothetical protein
MIESLGHDVFLSILWSMKQILVLFCSLLWGPLLQGKEEEKCPLIWPFVVSREWTDYAKWKRSADTNDCLSLSFRQHGTPYVGRVVHNDGKGVLWRKKSFFTPRKRSEIFLGDTFRGGEEKDAFFFFLGKILVRLYKKAEMSVLYFDQEHLFLLVEKGSIDFKLMTGNPFKVHIMSREGGIEHKLVVDKKISAQLFWSRKEHEQEEIY